MSRKKDEKEVINAVKMFWNGRTAAVDTISGEALKYGCDLCMEWLCNLFNKCMETVFMP